MCAILHIGDIAGVPQELSRAQRKLGFLSDVISFKAHPFDYGVELYYPTKLPFPMKYAEKMLAFYRVVADYDILHFHYSSVVPFGFDLPLWKRLNKMVVLHHHGDDIRRKGEGRIYSKFADSILVSTPDLIEWSPNAKWVPNPIDLERYQYVGTEDHSGNLRIAHAPSDRAVKGTEHVIKAVKSLIEEGYDVELVLIENMPHQMAIEQYKHADIVVDQLLVGWYGVLAIECMALGKPVCVYIREDLQSYLPSSPIVNVSPKSLKEDLRLLVEDASMRKKIGERARRFVDVTHDAKKIAKNMVEMYINLTNNKELAPGFNNQLNVR